MLDTVLILNEMGTGIFDVELFAFTTPLVFLIDADDLSLSPGERNGLFDATGVLAVDAAGDIFKNGLVDFGSPPWSDSPPNRFIDGTLIFSMVRSSE